ncbi:hypothetical protein HYG93_02350 [Acinetobacter sp. SwsAc6]|nr:hypothetical protein [Acinetobacter sp. SwsAc6]
MIIGFAVMSILALIACAFLYAKEAQVKDLSKQLFDEKGVSSHLRNEKHHEWERAETFQQEIIAHKQEIADIKATFKNSNDDGDFGKVIHWTNQMATSQTYYLTFVVDPNGRKIMNDFENRFKRSLFTNDERETCRRIGQSEVFDFISNRISNAQSPNYSEQLEIAYLTGQLESNYD